MAKDVSLQQQIKSIDNYLKQSFPANEPGIAVLAVKNGKVVFRGGYGMANMELGVPIKPEMVFRLGSITKQFTAAAIMMLVERGKISLTDDITKFIPDYPTKGHKITVHHLLNHTSGIKSYTDIPEWFETTRMDRKPMELVEEFKDKPMDFKPGEKWHYNNSGYNLLGVIIEKVTGESYAAFIDKEIFKRLGMKNSYYGGHKQIIPNRVSGYSKTGSGFEHANFISMTLPYSAGSLLSTVDDMLLWDRALFSGRLISEASLKKMTAPTRLKDGKIEQYGYGFLLNELFGETAVGHGGGIFGFNTYGLRLPGKDIYVVSMNNCPGNGPGPNYVSQWIAALLAGKDVKVRTAKKISTDIMDEIVGVYEIKGKEPRTITREGEQLYSQRSGSMKLKVFAESETVFFYKASFSHFSIVRDKKGKVVKMIMHRPDGDEVAIRTDKKVKARKEITLDPAVFASYEGIYRGGPGLELTISTDKGKYYGQIKSQPPVEIFPESKTKFFLKVVDAQLEFNKDKDGKVLSVTLFQSGRQFVLKREE